MELEREWCCYKISPVLHTPDAFHPGSVYNMGGFWHHQRSKCNTGSGWRQMTTGSVGLVNRASNEGLQQTGCHCTYMHDSVFIPPSCITGFICTPSAARTRTLTHRLQKRHRHTESPESASHKPSGPLHNRLSFATEMMPDDYKYICFLTSPAPRTADIRR